jgi:hypothetical protein
MIKLQANKTNLLLTTRVALVVLFIPQSKFLHDYKKKITQPWNSSELYGPKSIIKPKCQASHIRINPNHLFLIN